MIEFITGAAAALLLSAAAELLMVHRRRRTSVTEADAARRLRDLTGRR